MRRIEFAAFLFLIALTAAAAPPSAVVTTIAGQPTIAGYWDGPPQDALFTHPTWLDVAVNGGPGFCADGANGEIFVVDRINQLLRRIALDGTVTTMHFTDTGFYALPQPLDFGTAFGGGILVEPPGAGCGCGPWARGIYVSSSATNQVLLLSPQETMASRDQLVILKGLQTPLGIGRSWKFTNEYVAGLLARKLYVADSGSHTIKVTVWGYGAEGCPIPYGTTVLAGQPGVAGHADGKGSEASFDTPRAVAGAPDGSVYVSDAHNHTIRRIAPDGTVTTVAGVPGVAGSDDAHLNTPSGIDVDEKGEVFFVDTFNHAVRMLTTDGQLVTVAGQLGVSGFADGDGKTAKFNAPVGLKVAPDGSIVVADTGNNVIRRITLAP